jgi:hypothetical protein
MENHSGPIDASQYRSIVGALRYLTLTQSDISFAINRVCQFLRSATSVHCERVKRIVRYVKGTCQSGLKYVSSASQILSKFSDTDWAGCPNDRRYTGGFTVFLGFYGASGNRPPFRGQSTVVEYKSLAGQCDSRTLVVANIAQ